MKQTTRSISWGAAVVVALAFPLAAPAAHVFETTGDEAGSRIVNHPSGILAPRGEASLHFAKGELSPDRQFVYLGDEGGWQLRPMEYGFRGGRLVHLDDPPGHMEAQPDTSPASAAQRARLERGGR